MRRRQSAETRSTNPLYGKFDQMVDAVLGPSTKASRSRKLRCRSCGHEWGYEEQGNSKTCPKCKSTGAHS